MSSCFPLTLLLPGLSSSSGLESSMSFPFYTAFLVLLCLKPFGSIGSFTLPPICHGQRAEPTYWPDAMSKLQCPGWSRLTAQRLCTTGFQDADESSNQQCPSSRCHCEYDVEERPVLRCTHQRQTPGQMTDYYDNQWTTFSELSTGTKHGFWPLAVCGGLCRCRSLTPTEKWRMCLAMGFYDEQEQDEREAWCGGFMTRGNERIKPLNCQSQRDCPPGQYCPPAGSGTDESRACIVSRYGDTDLENEEHPCSSFSDCRDNEVCVLKSILYSSSQMEDTPGLRTYCRREPGF